jgi:hypothetical protein
MLLSQITSIEELTISIFRDPFFINPEVWIAINRLVDQPQFVNLRRITFNLDRFGLGGPHQSGNVRLIRSKLPACVLRGLLRFC